MSRLSQPHEKLGYWTLFFQENFGIKLSLEVIVIVALNEWICWLKTRPRSFKIFVLLILIKPILDILWDVKIPTTPITFLQCFGLFLAVLVSASLFMKRPYSVQQKNWTHLFFLFWVSLQLINEILVLATYFSVDALRLTLKVAMPIYIYLFYRRYIFSKKDLDGVLSAFYFSQGFIVLNFFYHLFFTPSNITFTRGLVRLETGFGDISNLGIGVNLSMIIVGYFLLQNHKSPLLYKRTLKLFYANLVIGILILFNINHAASSIIFVMILSLLLVYNNKLRPSLLFVLLVGLGYLVHSNVYEDKILKLYHKDISVIRGEAERNQAFHGRAGRWQRHFELFSKQNDFAQLVGLIGLDSPGLIGHGPHNDYLRILYSSGYLGLLFYVLFLLSVFYRSLLLKREKKFLLFAVLTYVILQSVTLTPTTYHSVNFIFMATVVWLQLPTYNRELNFSPLPLRRKSI